ncbi:MAG: GntR family transcriptional regulator [Phycisphaeraceae bacterium]
MASVSVTKSQQAVAALRRKIVAGQWPPGRQLPTRPELERELGISRMTLQRVMDQLLAEGFIRVNGRAGTFVADRPPHRSRFALLAPFSGTEHGSRFWDTMAAEARQLNVSDEAHSFSVFYDIWPDHRDAAQYEELVAQVRAHRFAGLIFASAPQGLQETPLLNEPGIPRVAVTTARLDWPVVVFDRTAWMDRACAHVHAGGARRVAIFAEDPRAFDSLVNEASARWDLHIPTQWRLYLTHRLPAGVRHCAHLLMSLPRAERPDALLIADDHLVEPVALGLADAGVNVPTDVQVIAHANFPRPPASAVPVVQLGYDVRQVLRHCIDLIDLQRQGETPTARTAVGPLFEHEWRAAAEKDPPPVSTSV